jgi:hypothetical protein
VLANGSRNRNASQKEGLLKGNACTHCIRGKGVLQYINRKNIDSIQEPERTLNSLYICKALQIIQMEIIFNLLKPERGGFVQVKKTSWNLNPKWNAFGPHITQQFGADSSISGDL